MNATPQLGFVEAVKSVLTQYVGFNGRARRSEYWWFTLFTVVLGLITQTIDTQILHVDPTNGFGLNDIVSLALFLPGLAVAVRRLHDIGRSGWWVLIAFTVIGIFVLIYWYAKDSQPGANRFGESPKYPGMGTPGQYVTPGMNQPF